MGRARKKRGLLYSLKNHKINFDVPEMNGIISIIINEEFYQKYNFRGTPELSLSRVFVQNTLNHWGFLFSEDVIGEEFIDRLYNPFHIINFWETLRARVFMPFSLASVLYLKHL